MGWNPRFVAFCHSHGMTPEQYKALGKGNVDFIIWSNKHVNQWKAMEHERHLSTDGRYDAWLAELYPPPRLPHGARECSAAQLDIFNDTKEPAA
ncbi:hypothetical protein [Pseudomonas multiresinivorans]|uniref:Uncharacterized protein n=1 Tax=Pseudomonas multiresinivorans TaxID=95301 RepID=A0A7Z3BMG3_9PSED|nr:hypothetical protein [Pseudomonas multiresinivorans]QJP09037.1 hypothetical protein G4G71_14555 [Pseudomonas multiresinivorans]